MRKAVVVIIVLAVAACASAAFAQQGQDGARRGAGFGMGGTATALTPPSAPMIDRVPSLNLSTETKDKLRAVLTKGDETLRPLRQKLAEASRALRQSLMAEEFNEAKFKEDLAASGKAEMAVIDAEIAVWKEIRAAITPDEFKALREAMTRMAAPRRSGGQGRPGQGGPGPGSGNPPAPPAQ